MQSQGISSNANILLRMQLALAIRALDEICPCTNPFEGRMNFSRCQCEKFKQMYEFLQEANEKLKKYRESEIPSKPESNFLPKPALKLEDDKEWKINIFQQEFPDGLKNLICAFSINTHENDSTIKQRIVEWKISESDQILIWDENLADWTKANPKINPWKNVLCSRSSGTCHTWFQIEENYFSENWEELEKILETI